MREHAGCGLLLGVLDRIRGGMSGEKAVRPVTPIAIVTNATAMMIQP
jgi:hypothetical protein